jgi:PAS domain S-box-containing protein
VQNEASGKQALEQQQLTAQQEQKLLASVDELGRSLYQLPTLQSSTIVSYSVPAITRSQEIRSAPPVNSLLWIGLFILGILCTGSFILCYWLARQLSQQKVAPSPEQDSYTKHLEQLAQAFKSSPVILAITDFHNRCYVEVNDSFLDTFGYAREEVVGRTTLEVNNWYSLESREQFRQQLDSQRVVHAQEHQFVTKTGEIITGIVSAEILELGQTSCILSVIEDITEHKRTAEALRRAQEKYRSIFENAIDGIYQTTLEGHYLNVNPALARMLGFASPSAMLNSGFNAKQAYADPQCRLEFIQTIEQHGAIANFEALVPRQDGTQIWISETAWAVRDQQGTFQYYEGFIRDISERKRAQEALQKQFSRTLLLRKITEKIRSTLDTQSIFETAATEIGQAFNVSRCIIHTYRSEPIPQIPWMAEYVANECESLIGLNIPVQDNLHALQVLQQDRAIASPDVYADPLLKSTECLNRKIGLRSMLAVRTSYNGEPNGLITLHQCDHHRHWLDDEIDLLESVAAQVGIALAQAKLLEQEKQQRAELARQNIALDEAKQIAEAASRYKTTFLANMSHELRTPLNAILGFTQILVQDPNITTDQRDNLTIINRSGEHLLRLINDILDMSKIEAGKAILNETSCDIYDLLNSLEETFQLQAREKGIQLIVHQDETLPSFILVDEGKLRQVLINLLSNAIKFTDRGYVKLLVQAQVQGGEFNTDNVENSCRLYCQIEDTGAGIKPEEIGSIFEPFVQSEVGRKSQQGSGLGLAISRKFVQLMGGDLSVESHPNVGTTFSFDILVRASICAHPSRTVLACELPMEQASGRPSYPRYRILVVDDLVENCQLLVRMLRPLGFDIETADQGDVAIAKWQHWQPHLIWMDMRMPVVDGYEATRQIRNLESLQSHDLSTTAHATKIIALTANAFADERQHILNAGCDDVLYKPFSLQELLQKLSDHLKLEPHHPAYQSSSFNDLNFQPQSWNHSLHSKQLSIDDFKEINQDWLLQIQQAATRADARSLLHLIEQLPQTQLDLKEKLTDLVHDFRFDLIMSNAQNRLTQEFIKQEQSSNS